MSQGFSDAAIRSFEPRVLELVQRLCDILQGDLNSKDGKWSQGQDMAKWCIVLWIFLKMNCPC